MNFYSYNKYLIILGYDLLLKQGTWHDFPVSLGNPVTVLTFNSAEVVEALVAMRATGEMLGQGNVYKIDIQKRLNVKVTYQLQLTTNNEKKTNDT